MENQVKNKVKIVWKDGTHIKCITGTLIEENNPFFVKVQDFMGVLWEINRRDITSIKHGDESGT